MRSGDDKTSIMFATADKPGALVHVLQAFERHSINLTHIEKRPSGKRNWTYTFFVDAQGHREDSGMAAALADAKPRGAGFAVDEDGGGVSHAKFSFRRHALPPGAQKASKTGRRGCLPCMQNCAGRGFAPAQNPAL